jgi:LuxR family transcriptional regulator, maltose regulon positive regulatory protein
MARTKEQAAATARRHIIERPRLMRHMDETTARVIMLVAPAGYGKTTAARQWLERRPHAWYRASLASSDVAATALGLAQAAAGPGDKTVHEIGEWLRATPEPQLAIETASDLLRKRFAAWQPEQWLAIDDYQFIDSDAAEMLVWAVVEQANVRLLLTSRRRPKWARPRNLLYGEFYELGPDVLALDDQEAMEVLRDSRTARAMMTLAGGWPAVIGLAAFADLGPLLGHAEFPRDLHNYIADELFASLDETTQLDLCRLALLPRLTPALVRQLLARSHEDALQKGVESGFLVPASKGGAVELHPLLRNFLLERLDELESPCLERELEQAFKVLLANRAWEEAFELLTRYGFDHLERLLAEALDPLLEEGRVETVRAWLNHARRNNVQSPAVDLLDGEVAARAGLHAEAKLLAIQAAEGLGTESELKPRALLLAGRSANLADSPSEALDHFTSARALAQSDQDLQRALWGEFICSVELGVKNAHEILNEFEKTAPESVDEVIRAKNGRLYLGTRYGGLRAAIEDARGLVELALRAQDPAVRVSFFHIYAGALRLAADYRQAGKIVSLGLAEVEKYRIEFARPHLELTKAAVSIGIGALSEADAALREVERLSDRTADDYVAMSAATVRCRLLLLQGAITDALAATAGTWPSARARGQRGEFLATRALAFGLAGDAGRASVLLSDAELLCSELEGSTLCAWVRVLLELAQGSSDSSRHVRDAFRANVQNAVLDTFVFAYRLNPAILEILAEDPTHHEILERLAIEAGDESRARRAGLLVPDSKPSSTTLLTPREREVYELLASGRTNKEIAGVLFITEVTVKVHVRRILKKLGARTRTEVAILATRKRLR